MTADQVKGLAREAGFELIGIASAAPPQSVSYYEAWLDEGMHAQMGYLARHLDAKRTLESLLPAVRSVLAVGLNYLPGEAERPGYPKIARYARGRDYHSLIRSKLRPISRQLTGESRICIDAQPLLERELALRAGLGWFGKNTLLINSHRGSWFNLGFLLSTETWEPDLPAVGGCGTCHKCIDACPTGAIVPQGNRWVVDSRECISYLTIEHRGPLPDASQIGDWTFGCDICQEVCPFNEARPSQPMRAQVTREPDYRRENPLLDLTLDQIQTLTYAEWDRLTRGSPIRRAGFDGLKRNVAANLLYLRSKSRR